MNRAIEILLSLMYFDPVSQTYKVCKDSIDSLPTKEKDTVFELLKDVKTNPVVKKHSYKFTEEFSPIHHKVVKVSNSQDITVLPKDIKPKR